MRDRPDPVGPTTTERSEILERLLEGPAERLHEQRKDAMRNVRQENDLEFQVDALWVAIEALEVHVRELHKPSE